MSILIIAEKPSLGQDIANAIDGNGVSKDGCIYKGDYIITWVFGHMLSLKEPEDYDEKYKSWVLEDLPIYFENWDQKISPSDGGRISKASRVKQIGTLLKSADMVIHAGDPDDEGQFLIDELLRWFNYTGPVKRLSTGDTTKASLKKALLNMEDNKKREKDGYAAMARSVADLMVGVNMSRYFSLLNNKRLTVGRVQTPTLGLVVKRDEQIEGHKKQLYYELFADAEINSNKIKVKFTPNKDNPNLIDDKILDKKYLEKINSFLNDNPNQNYKITKKEVKEQAPLPFNLVKLQTYCGNKFKYSPKEVMEITQSLRENYKAITYNRSDCQYLSEEHYKEAPKTMESVIANIGYKPSALDMTLKSKCFNDANITAHFAIIPTNTRFDISKLNEREKNVYMAICKYYMAQFLPPAIKEKTELIIKANDEITLKATSTRIIKPGYLKIFKEAEKDEEGALSDIPAGEGATSLDNISIEQKETKPPTRYTKTSLNEDMTRIAKYVDDEEIKKLLLEKDKDKKGENGSIGTTATRDSIVEGLIKKGFLEEKSGKLISTPIGRELYRILPDEIKKADMTAKWWVIQEKIKDGSASPETLEKDVLKTIKEIILQEHDKIVYDESLSKIEIGRCPFCGRPVYETSKTYTCSEGRDDDTCSFVLFKDNLFFKRYGKKLTTKMVKDLLKDKKTLVKKIKKQNGEGTYDAYFSLEQTTNKNTGKPQVSFSLSFPNQSSSSTSGAKKGAFATCPKCHKPIYENSKAFGCSGFRDTPPCNFTLWKNNKTLVENGISLSLDEYQELINNGSVVAKGFNISLDLSNDKYVNVKVEKI